MKLWAASTIGFAVLVGCASSDAAVPPYRNPTAGAEVALQIRGMHRAQVIRNLAYRQAPVLRMDVYRPRGVPRSRLLPAVLLGGPPAFDAGRRSGQKIGWAQLVSASGMAAVAFDIRSDAFLTRPGEPTADVAAAIEHVRANAATLGIDANRLCTLGFSIGTAPWHLAAVMRGPEPHVLCNAVYYGPLDFGDPVWQQAFGVDPATLVEFSALSHLRAHGSRISPMFVAKAGREGNPGINASIDRFVEAARGAGAPVELVTHATGRHAFDIVNRNTRTRTIIRRTLAFFRTHLLA